MSTTYTYEVAPPNSLVLVCDAAGGDVPASFGEGIFSATASCIVIGCRPEVDGPTKFLTGPVAAVRDSRMADFVATIQTPSLVVTVETVYGDKLISADVTSSTTRVEVWANDLEEPDEIVIGLSATE